MKNKTIIIDNYDSFTYNLVHIVEELQGSKVTVVKNDEVDFDKLTDYSHIILSPGPGIPDEAGDLKKVIQKMAPTTNILGVCLGLQAMGEVFGAQLKNLNDVFHGMRTLMYQTENVSLLFNGIDSSFYAGRYHSWVIDNQSDISQFIVNAIDEDGEIMAITHKEYPSYAVQFHPESIMTDDGKRMIENFLNIQ